MQGTAKRLQEQWEKQAQLAGYSAEQAEMLVALSVRTAGIPGMPGMPGMEDLQEQAACAGLPSRTR